MAQEDGSHPAPVAATASATKVVELRPARRPPAGRAPAGEATLDLQAQIDNLRLLKTDLEAYRWEHRATTDTERGECYQVAFWIRQLADRTAALEGILMDKGTSQLLLRGMTPAEEAALRAASSVIEQWIREDTPFPTVFRTVAAILAAADRIAMRAAGGTPTAEAISRRPR